jgi:hypothetical protein
MTMPHAPIALFTFNRLWHTQQTVAALLKNPEAADTDLIIYADGARHEKDRDAVDEVRDFLKTISGFKSVEIFERTHNFGLAASIIDGVSAVVAAHGQVIVMEDDLLTSPHFLSYMNEALALYENTPEVVSIHAYCYPIKAGLPEAFFLRGADCWGWATWARGWELFNPDGAALLAELERRDLVHEFDYDGSYPYATMLKNQIAGKNNSWAIRWYASAFLADKLTLYPGRSLVHNTGNDDSGTHASGTAAYDTVLSDTLIELSALSPQASAEGRASFVAYFRAHKRGRLSRFGARLLGFLKRRAA